MLVLGSAEQGFAGGDFIFQLVTFLILLVLLKKFAWGPLMGIMQKREDYVNNEISQAEKNHEEAKKLVEEHREMIKQSRIEGQEFITAARKQGEDQKEQIILAARAESERLKEMAKKEIENERDQAVATLRQQVASLSVLVASKVIEKELNEQEQAKLIEDYIKEAGDLK